MNSVMGTVKSPDVPFINLTVPRVSKWIAGMLDNCFYVAIIFSKNIPLSYTRDFTIGKQTFYNTNC